MSSKVTPMERTLAALSFKEADRVPLFLFLTLHGAKELGMPIHEYLSNGKNVARGQIALQERIGHDCYYSFFYAAVEVEAMGGEVLFNDDGPPIAGEPFLKKVEQIAKMEPPRIEDSPSLLKVLEAIERLYAHSQGSVPIIGVVMSPFSLPVMQMGYGPYIELMMEQPEPFAQLMALNEAFCTAWARAQVKAGATAICYFDPLSSPTTTQPEVTRRTGFPIARRMISSFGAPVATHFASGRVLRVLDDVVASGADLIGVTVQEDLAEVRAASRGRINVLGNLNGITMRRWSKEEAFVNVRDTLRAAGRGGGFILADNHGEIPWQVPDQVILAIAEATRKFGTFDNWLANEQ